MEISEKLKSKKIVDYHKNLKKDLKEQAEKGLISKLFSKSKLKKEVAELGLLLLGKNDYYEEITLGSSQADKIKELIKVISGKIKTITNYWFISSEIKPIW